MKIIKKRKYLILDYLPFLSTYKTLYFLKENKKKHYSVFKTRTYKFFKKLIKLYRFLNVFSYSLFIKILIIK